MVSKAAGKVEYAISKKGERLRPKYVAAINAASKKSKNRRVSALFKALADAVKNPVKKDSG